MNVRKAIIPAAGYGTRFLPITKTVQKEMMPILNRPIIDYVVEDCLRAGVTEIIFVVRKGDYQIRDFYKKNARLARHLSDSGKTEAAEQLEELASKAEWHFIEQTAYDGYGTAVPIKLAQDLVKKEEAFLVYMGDDFIYHEDETSEAGRLIELAERSGAVVTMNTVRRPQELLHKYGVLDIEERDGFKFLRQFVEKPEPGKAPSDLVNISKFVMRPAALKAVNAVARDDRLREFLITDALIALAKKDQGVAVHVSEGEYLDCGYVAGWLKANLRLAAQDPATIDEVQEMMRKL